MVRITDEMRSASQKRFDEACERVDRQIKRAVEQGRTSTYFDCDYDVYPDIYDRVRTAYEKEGYRIVPTGCIGGVWQATEDICW